MQESGKRIEIFFQARQLQVRDLTYILNNLTSAFRHAVFQLNDNLGATLNRDEYVLRLSEMNHGKTTTLSLRVAATKKGVQLASPEAIESLRSELTEELFKVLSVGDVHKRLLSFRKAIVKKAPRISKFTVRLINTSAAGEEKIEGVEKWID